MALGCIGDNSNPFATLSLADLDSHPCKLRKEEDWENSFLNVSVTLEECGTMCHRSEKSYGDNGVDRVNNISDSNNFQEFRDVIFFPHD